MVARDKEDYPVNSDKNQHQISQFILEPVTLTELDSLLCLSMKAENK